MKKTTITLKTNYGKEIETGGYVVGNFLVHKDRNDRHWLISHKTGYAIPLAGGNRSLKRRKDALKVVEAASDPGWDFETRPGYEEMVRLTRSWRGVLENLATEPHNQYGPLVWMGKDKEREALLNELGL